jgi:hypothetical protein
MINPVFKQGKKCVNEEEKRERYLTAQLRYATRPYTCTCGRTVQIGNKSKHLKSKIHLRSLSA